MSCEETGSGNLSGVFFKEKKFSNSLTNQKNNLRTLMTRHKKCTDEAEKDKIMREINKL